MARYLIVAYQTAGSPELAERVRSLVAEDPEAEFTLLVPATPPSHLHTWEEGEARQLAMRRGTEAAAGLSASGATIAAVVVSTFPPGLSRWLKGELPNQLRRRTRLPVHHVIAAPAKTSPEHTPA